MQIDLKTDLKTLTITLSGKLDANTSIAFTDKTNILPDGITKIVIDAAELTYISSAGLRCMLTLQKKAKAGNCSLQIVNASSEVLGVFDITGFSSLISITPKRRKISVENCPIVGKGVTGTCYKFDDETVVKLYSSSISDELVEKEKRYAKTAFVAGIPTAISYEIVECGNQKGVLYEMINASSLTKKIESDIGNLESYAKLFAEFCLKLASTKIPAGVCPDAKQLFMGYVKQMHFLTPDEQKRLSNKIESLPDSDTAIHGDLHSGNLMIQNGELMMIDMGDFSTGFPLFETGQIYNIYGMGKVDDVMHRVINIPFEDGVRFWNIFENIYFGAETDAERAEAKHKASFFRYLQQMHFLTYLPEKQFRKDMLKNELLPRLDEWKF